MINCALLIDNSLVSFLGGGNSLAPDVTGSKSAKGTNVEIYDYTGNDAQQFKLEKMGAGYILKTKVSGEKSCVEIADADIGNGGNVQEWEVNGNSCQVWVFEKLNKKRDFVDIKFYNCDSVISGG